MSSPIYANLPSEVAESIKNLLWFKVNSKNINLFNFKYYKY